MSQTTEITAAGRYIILIAAFLGWMFSGFQMAVMTLIGPVGDDRVSAQRAVVAEPDVATPSGCLSRQVSRRPAAGTDQR